MASETVRRVGIDDYQSPVREVARVEWRGTGRLVGILHLSVGELLDAHMEARREFQRRAIPADEWSSEELDREEMTQQCYRLLVDPDAGDASARVFETVKQARERLTAEDRLYFLACYQHAFGTVREPEEQ